MNKLVVGAPQVRVNCKEFDNPVYPFTFNLCLDKSDLHTEETGIAASCYPGPESSFRGDVFLVMPEPAISTMVHEISHLVDIVQEGLGTLGNGEARAYLAQWFARIITAECNRRSIDIIAE